MCACELFVPLSPPHAFLSDFFFIQALLSIVSFCVRDVFNFQLTDEEELLGILYLYDSVISFDRYFFLGVLTLIILLDFSSWHGIIYI